MGSSHTLSVIEDGPGVVRFLLPLACIHFHFSTNMHDQAPHYYVQLQHFNLFSLTPPSVIDLPS